MVPIADGEISVLRFGAETAPPLLFAHANGFCASAYRQMFEALGDRFNIFGVDLRGFGRTTLPTDPDRHRSMDAFSADINLLVDALASNFSIRGRWIFAGHSLGGASATLAAVGRRDIAALRLIEPVATPRRLAMLARTPLWSIFVGETPLVRGARGRRAAWPDRASVRESYSKKPLFSTWADGVLDDYLDDGLRDEEGAVTLSCAPAWEAATFAGQAHDFWRAVDNAPAPLTVLAARHQSTTVPREAVRALGKRGVRVVTVEGRTHLFPFEDPSAAAEFLAGA